jgi:hypothetical protein
VAQLVVIIRLFSCSWIERMGVKQGKPAVLQNKYPPPPRVVLAQTHRSNYSMDGLLVAENLL